MGISVKIVHESGEKYYSFNNKDKLLLGRSSQAEVQVVLEGVSRQHLYIYHDNGEFFVEEAGSTNGSYINDEPLEVGKKYDFNTFFPIKLGFDVYLYLLDSVDEENLSQKIAETEKVNFMFRADREKVEAGDETAVQNIPRVIKSSKSRSTKTGISKNTTEYVNKKAEKKAAQKNKTDYTKFVKAGGFLVVAALVGNYVYQDYLDKKEKQRIVMAKIKREAEEKRLKIEAEAKAAAEKIRMKALTNEEIEASLVMDRCISDLELELCEKFKSKERAGIEGIIKFADGIFIHFIPTDFRNMEEYKEYTPEEKKSLFDYVAKKYGYSKARRLKSSNVFNLPNKELFPKIQMVSELLHYDYTDELKSHHDITRITLVNIKSVDGKVEIQDTLQISVKEFLKFGREELMRRIKYVYLSGINESFLDMMEKIEIK